MFLLEETRMLRRRCKNTDVFLPANLFFFLHTRSANTVIFTAPNESQISLSAFLILIVLGRRKGPFNGKKETEVITGRGGEGKKRKEGGKGKKEKKRGRHSKHEVKEKKGGR